MLPIEILACNLDQGQPGFPSTILPACLDKMQIPSRIEYQDTYSIVKDKVPAGRTYCALRSRLRRGNIYCIAREEGCSAVVLWHVAEVDCQKFSKALNYPIIPCDLAALKMGFNGSKSKKS